MQVTTSINTRGIKQYKFRVYDKVSQKMFYFPDKESKTKNSLEINQDEIKVKIDGKYLTDFMLMEYTGLDSWTYVNENDEDGIEIGIYEGDIVEIMVKANEWTSEHFGINKNGNYLATIQYDEDSMGFSHNYLPLKNGKFSNMHPCLTHLRLADLYPTVVGNIYQNPELLEKITKI